MQNISRKERERLVREQEIIDAAEKIFGSKGIDGASMEHIAKEAQFTRKTLYKYFRNKEDLYFEVIIKATKLLYLYIEEKAKSGKNGFEKLHLISHAYYNFYVEHTVLFNLMNKVGQFKSKENCSCKMNKYENEDIRLIKIISQIIDQGKSDGSMRSDIDTMTTTYTIIFLVTGFFYELSISGKTFTECFSLDYDQFVNNTLSLILNTFSSNKKYNLSD